VKSFSPFSLAPGSAQADTINWSVVSTRLNAHALAMSSNSLQTTDKYNLCYFVGLAADNLTIQRGH
jgi:hypothetical protein